MKTTQRLLLTVIMTTLGIYSNAQNQHLNNFDCGNVDSIHSIKSFFSCGSLFDHKPDEPNNWRHDQIYTVKLRVHILQQSISNPQNFENNQNTVDYFNQQIHWVNDFYRTINPPSRQVLNPSDELTDSRIQFQLQQNDILFHIDPIGWDRFVLSRKGPYIFSSIGPVGAGNTQFVSTIGNLTIGSQKLNVGYELIINVNGVDELFEVISVAYNSTTNTTNIEIFNPNNFSILTSSFEYTYQFSNLNCSDDNYIKYGSEDYLDVFVTAGSNYNYQVPVGCGPSGSWLNMSNMLFGGDFANAQLLAHEIGHCLGLNHTNTPQFSDLPSTDQFCFCPCNTTTVSNNVMGYNQCRDYFSPLQISRMRQVISSDTRGLLQRTVNCNENENVSLVVNTNSTWNYNQATRGNLIIKNNSTLTVTCRVNLPPNAKVIIESGSKLILDGGILTNDCGYMWLGIDVQGNRTIHQTSANQGVLEMKNGAIIEYAKNGIRTIGTDENDIKDWSKTGGIVRIYDGTFRNCRRGIEFLSYANMNPTGNGQEMSNQSFIHNANFVTDEVLPNNVIPYAGLTMFEVRGIQIRNCNFENIRTDIATVPVDERGSGIYSIDANYKVTSGYNISTGNPIAGTGNEFSNLYYGIYTSGGTEWSDVIINDNDFNNCAFGVGLTGTNYATIGRNNFAIKGGNGTPTLFGQGFGVYTEGAYGFNIEQNTYTSLDPSGFPDQAVHVKQSSDVGTGKVYKNTITNTTYGTQTANNNESLKIDCNNYNKGTKSTIDIHNALGDLANQGDCSLNGVPAKNLFSGTCDNTSLSQIYNNGNPFIYTYEGTTLDPNCTNLGTNAVPCGLPIANGCPPKLPNNVITPKPVRLSQVKGKIGIVKTDINSLKTNIEEGDSENLMTAIATQNTGNLKNTLMAKSPYLSDRVLNAYLTKPQQAPPGHIKEVVIANSPVTNEIKEVIDLMSLPNGIRNQINAAQVGISVRTELENQLKALDKERMLLIDEVVREYADTNWLDSAIVFLKDEGSISALCALVPMEVRKDTVSAKIHISSIRNEADNLEQRNPTDERIDAMRGFCNFHETLMKVKSKEGSYFNLDSKELLSLEALAQSELAVSYNAKAILNFINEEIPLYQGYDAFFPKSMTLEESETLISSENYFDFKAYPNPSNGNVTFTIDEKMEGNKTIVITDLLGKVIRILPVNNPTINYEFINVPQGTYLAHLVMDGQIEKTIKVMYVE